MNNARVLAVARKIPRKPAKGFTLVELAIVMAVIGLLLAVTMVALNQIENTRISNSETLIVDKIRSGIAQYVSRSKSITGLTKNYLTNTVGLPSDTPWGLAWTIAVAGNQVDITWPTGGADACTELSRALTVANYNFLAANSSCGGAGNADLSVSLVVR